MPNGPSCASFARTSPKRSSRCAATRCSGRASRPRSRSRAAQDPAFLAELFITSTVRNGDAIAVAKTDNYKCGRCWRYLPEVKDDGDLCARCDEVVNA